MVAWEWYSNPTTFCVWMHLLIEANHETKQWHGFEITAGQLVTSLHSLAKSTGLSVQQIRTALNNLKSTHEITMLATKKFSIVTICMYDEYQSQKRRGQQSKQQSDQQEINTNIRSEEANNAKDKKLKIKKDYDYGKEREYDPRRGTDVPTNPKYGQGF